MGDDRKNRQIFHPQRGNFGHSDEKNLVSGQKNFEEILGWRGRKWERWRHDGVCGLKNFFGKGVDKRVMQVYIKQA